VDEPVLRALGARGIVRLGGNALQVVLGPIADQVAGEIRSAAVAPVARDPCDLATAIVDVLGPAGICAIARCGSRLVIELDDPSAFSATELDRLRTRGWVRMPQGVHIIIGPDAGSVQTQINGLLVPS
jgi:N-acetylglucosamine PTS system EIICBA or EIICB component